MKKDELNVIQTKQAKLKRETEELIAKKDELERNKKTCEDKLERAAKLITLTKDEAIRWKESVQNLEIQIENLLGDVFISSAAVKLFFLFLDQLQRSLHRAL